MDRVPEHQYFKDQPAPPFPQQKIRPPGIEEKMDPRPHYEAPMYRSAGKLRGKIVLITGGDSGIGRSVAVLCAREGADVAFTYLPEEMPDAQVTNEHVGMEGRQCLAVAGDLTSREFCESVVSRCVERFGRIDVLVNNAAFQKHVETIEELTLEQWDRCFKTNIYPYFVLAKAAVPHMPPGSSIINTGSITGLEGSAGLLDYAATKGAIHAFTKSLAKQLVKREIRVNCVAPGPVWTPLNPAERKPQESIHFGEDTALGRPAQPEEIAPTFIFLASEADSGFINGEVITLLGGETRAA